MTGARAVGEIEIPLTLLDDELVGIVTLAKKDTGIDGTLYVPTAQGSHGPCVRWFPARPGRAAPCLPVPIGPRPTRLNQNLPPRLAAFATGPVGERMALNHVALLDVWDNGVSWTRDEVNAFFDGLKKLP